MPQAELVRALADEQADSQVLHPAAAIRLEDPQRDAHLGAALAFRPAFDALLVGVGRKQVEAQDVDSARPQGSGDGFQVAPGGRFREQVPESVERAVGGVDRPVEREFRHVRPKDIRLQPPPRQASLEIGQRRLAEVESDKLVAPRGQLRHQAARAAGRFEQAGGAACAVLVTGGFDEIRFEFRLRAECDVIVLRIVVPVGDDCAFGHGALLSVVARAGPARLAADLLRYIPAIGRSSSLPGQPHPRRPPGTPGR
mgnify:CR=1 FL=1